MTPTAYQALAVHTRSVALRDAYLAFLADCIAECDREHSPEEVAAAAEYLARKRKPQKPLDLRFPLGQ